MVPTASRRLGTGTCCIYEISFAPCFPGCFQYTVPDIVVREKTCNGHRMKCQRYMCRVAINGMCMLIIATCLLRGHVWRGQQIPVIPWLLFHFQLSKELVMLLCCHDTSSGQANLKIPQQLLLSSATSKDKRRSRDRSLAIGQHQYE